MVWIHLTRRILKDSPNYNPHLSSLPFRSKVIPVTDAYHIQLAELEVNVLSKPSINYIRGTRRREGGMGGDEAENTLFTDKAKNILSFCPPSPHEKSYTY